MAGKKVTLLTIKQKAEILRKLSEGFSIDALAKSFHVHRSTINRIKNKKNTIRKFLEHAESGPGKRKTFKPAELPKMERALMKWFVNQRAKNLPITSDMLKQKAKFLHAKIQEKSGDFHASNGWITNCKKRYGIRRLKICGEKLSNKTHSVNPFLQKLNKKIADLGLTKDQIYNADESGIFWKLLPDRTLVRSKETSAPGHKISKERITFLACTNASGNHRVKLMVIGKSLNPRSLNNFTDIPVVYKGNKSAWMTLALFEEWFHKTFVPEVKGLLRVVHLPEKAPLLIDNAPCHPKDGELMSSDGQISVMCLPPNCTALIQPMDENVIRLTNLNYKTSLLSDIVRRGKTIDESLRTST